MNSFTNFAAKMGIIEEEKPVVAAAPTPPQTPVQVVPTVAPSADSVFDVAGLEATIDGLVTQDNSYAAFAAFETSLKSLEGVIPDEAVRFKAAAATSKSEAASLHAAISTSVQTVLERETNNFETSFIAALDAEIKQLEADETATMNEINDLTAKLGELSTKKTQLSSDKITKGGELAKARIDFQSVIQRLNQKYSTLDGKLQQYLGA